MVEKIGNGKTVLLIEDERFPHDIYKEQLKELGFSVKTARSFTEVEGQIHDIGKVDLILSDNNIYGNAEMDGVELGKDGHLTCIDWVKRFRAIDGNPNTDTPIILHTNTHVPYVRILEALEVGIEGFLHKSGTLLTAAPAQNLVQDLLNDKGQRGKKILATSHFVSRAMDMADRYVRADILSPEQGQAIKEKVGEAYPHQAVHTDGLGGIRPIIPILAVTLDFQSDEYQERLFDVFGHRDDLVIPIQDVAAFMLFMRYIIQQDTFSAADIDALEVSLEMPGHNNNVMNLVLGYFVNQDNDHNRNLVDATIWDIMEQAHQHPINRVRFETIMLAATEVIEREVDIEEARTLLSATSNQERQNAGTVLMAAYEDGADTLRDSYIGDESLFEVVVTLQKEIEELLYQTGQVEMGILPDLEGM